MNSIEILFIITRGYAPRGTYQDEFCTLWGFPEDLEFKWNDEPQEGMLVLVMHGYKGVNLCDNFHKSLEYKDDFLCNALISRAVIYSHSADEYLVALKNAIENKWNLSNILLKKYKSGESLSIYNLKECLEQDVQDIKFVNVVETMQKGLTIFLYQLIKMQSILLNFKFYLHTVSFINIEDFENFNTENPSAKLANIVDTESYNFWIDHLPKKIYLLCLNTVEMADFINSISILKIFGGTQGKEEFPKLMANEDWKIFDTPEFASNMYDATRKNEIMTDFQVLAKSLDTVLKVTQLISKKI